MSGGRRAPRRRHDGGAARGALSGHNLARRSPADGDPWYQSVAGFLVIVVPIVVGMRVYRQSLER